MSKSRMAGKKLSDLGFSPERMAELQAYAQGLQTGGTVSDYSQDYGFSADTPNNFRELDDPTSAGSLQADMRKIGQHLGYEHSGTLNPATVKDFILGNQEEAPATEGPKEPTQLSNRANRALAYTEAYEDFNMDGGATRLRQGNLEEQDRFLANYQLNLQRRMSPGVADTYGADYLGDFSRPNEFADMLSGTSLQGVEKPEAPSMASYMSTPNSNGQPPHRRSNIANAVIGQGAGFRQI